MKLREAIAYNIQTHKYILRKVYVYITKTVDRYIIMYIYSYVYKTLIDMTHKCQVQEIYTT